MTESHTTEHHIWNPETGITDIEGDPIKMSSSEMLGIKAIWTNQQSDLKDSGDTGKNLLSAFIERLSREWAIETGVIENLYDIDRGVTQTLIEGGLQADLSRHDSAKAPSEHAMHLIEDQKAVLDGIFDFVKGDRVLTISYIKEMHARMLHRQETTDAMTQDGETIPIPVIKGDWKDRENYPKRGNVIYKYCPVEQTASEMDRLIEMHEGHIKNNVPVDVQAAWLHHRFTQIHPFQDGNGRIARSIATLVLIKGGLFPMIITRDDKNYIEALEKADDGDLTPLIRLFAKLQRVTLRKTSVISKELLGEESIEITLDRLKKVATLVGERRHKSLKELMSDSAIPVKSHIKKQLTAVTSKMCDALKHIDDNCYAGSTSPGPFPDYRSNDKQYIQFFEIAKDHFGYVPNMNDHQSSVDGFVKWLDHTEYFSFLIHGMGEPSGGSMICTPLYIRPRNQEEESSHLMTPIAEEGFVFFYNEDSEQVIARLRPWCTKVFQAILEELMQSL